MNNDYYVEIPQRLNKIEHLYHLLIHMAKLGGSDLFLLGGCEVWLSLYGKKVVLTKRKISEKEIMGVFQSYYGVNAPSKLGSGEPIDTAIDFTHIEDGEKKRLRFRINATSCLRGGRNSITITFREIPTCPPKASDLGVEKEILNVCRATKQGLILIVGATGSGKSTLLAAILRDQLEDITGHRNLVTIESPIEFVYDDIERPCSIITQLEVGSHTPSFSAGVENSLRMAPTTILVGESRDYETIAASVEASITGHTVYSTVHANSVAETFQRMIACYPKEMQHQAKFVLVQSIKMIIAQRLAITVDGKRTAIREVLILTQDIKEKLATSENLGVEAFKMVRLHGRPMSLDITEKYEKGIISEQEYNDLHLNYEKV